MIKGCVSKTGREPVHKTTWKVDRPFSADHVLLSFELLLKAIQLFLCEDRPDSLPAATSGA